jgi:aspartyl-tRNA(Asn)/glutamyl-tRNA(Gln) amidotransferase subunit A
MVEKDFYMEDEKRNHSGKIQLGIIEDVLDTCDPLIVKCFTTAMDKFQSEFSTTIQPVTLPSLKYAIAAYYIIATAEASTNLAKYAGMRYGKRMQNYELYFDEFFTQHRSLNFGDEAIRRIILGTYARMAGYRDKYYLRALKIRKLMIEQFSDAFQQIDAIITPTMPILPPTLEKAKHLTPLENYALDILTVPPNLCGFPHLSLPIGYQPAPMGMQVITKHFNEELLFRLGKQWEEWFNYQTPPASIGRIEKTNG